MNLLNRLFRRGMSCEQVDAVMQQYLDNELDSSEVPNVLAHLEACKDCGLEADLYTRIKDSLHIHQASPSQDSMSKIRSLAQELASSGPPEGMDLPA